MKFIVTVITLFLFGHNSAVYSDLRSDLKANSGDRVLIVLNPNPELSTTLDGSDTVRNLGFSKAIKLDLNDSSTAQRAREYYNELTQNQNQRVSQPATFPAVLAIEFDENGKAVIKGQKDSIRTSQDLSTWAQTVRSSAQSTQVAITSPAVTPGSPISGGTSTADLVQTAVTQTAQINDRLKNLGATFQAGCNIVPPTAESFKDEDKAPGVLNSSDQNCYNAIPIPAGIENLPEYHAYVGGDKKHFVIPITKNPEAHLEPGDVLVYYRNVNTESTSLYEHIAKGRWHAAIVRKDPSGGLMHIDSYSSMSGSSFNNSRYHILRLRPYPTEVDSEEKLKQMQSSKDGKKRLERYSTQREAVLAQVQKNLDVMIRSGYGYDTDRITEVTIPEKLSKLRAQVAQGRCEGLRLYCSELPVTAFALAGVTPPSSESILQSLERVEKNVLPKIQEQNPGKSKDQIIDETMNHLFSDRAMLVEMGVGDEGLNHFKRTGELPTAIKKVRDEYAMLLKASPWQRRAMMALSKFTTGEDKGRLIGPSDLFDSIYDPKGSFSYVGTYVGDAYGCGTNANGHANPSLAGGGMGGGSDARSNGPAEETLKNHLASLYLHQQKINDFQFSPDGKKVVTMSDDNTVKIVNLENGNIKSINFQFLPLGIAFLKDSKNIVVAHNGSLNIFNIETSEQKKILSRNESIRSVQVSPNGKWLAFNFGSNKIQIFNLETSEVKTVKHDGNPRENVRFSSDSKYVLSMDYNTAQIINLMTDDIKIIKSENERGSIHDGYFLSDDKHVLIVTDNGVLSKTMNLDTGEIKRSSNRGIISSIEVSPSGNKLAKIHSRHFEIIDVMSGHTKEFNKEVDFIRFSPDEKNLVAINNDDLYSAKAISALSVETDEIKSINHRYRIVSAQFSPDNRYIATASGNTLRFFLTEDGNEETIAKALQEYDRLTRFHGDEFTQKQAELKIYVRLLFEKAKSTGRLNRDSAIKLMNTNVSTSEFRGFVNEGRTATDRHVQGLVDQVFPETPAAGPQPAQRP